MSDKPIDVDHERIGRILKAEGYTGRKYGPLRADVARLLKDLQVQVGSACHVPDCAECESGREDLLLLVSKGFHIGRERTIAIFMRNAIVQPGDNMVEVDCITRAQREALALDPIKVLRGQE